jgi:hypothetical protein
VPRIASIDAGAGAPALAAADAVDRGGTVAAMNAADAGMTVAAIEGPESPSSPPAKTATAPTPTDAKAETKSENNSGTKREIGPGTKTETRSGTKTAIKPDNKVETKVETTPEKEGTIDADAVSRVLEKSPRLQGCYLAEVAKDPTLGGKLVATVKLDVDGKVVESNAAGVSKAVASCIAEAMKRLKFPKPVGGPVTMNIPMSFEPPDKDAFEKGGTLTATTHSAGLPDSPSAAEIKAVLDGAKGKLATCSTGWDGNGRVTLAIAPDGSVTKAEAIGAFQGTEEGVCVERVLEKLTFPKSKSGVRVALPINLKSR